MPSKSAEESKEMSDKTMQKSAALQDVGKVTKMPTSSIKMPTSDP